MLAQSTNPTLLENGAKIAERAPTERALFEFANVLGNRVCFDTAMACWEKPMAVKAHPLRVRAVIHKADRAPRRGPQL